MVGRRRYSCSHRVLVVHEPLLEVGYTDNALPQRADAAVGPIEAITQRYFPVIPSVSTGAIDAAHFDPAGIPVYGVTGMWFDPDRNGQDGLNERVEVASVYVGRDYLTDLVRALVF